MASPAAPQEGLPRRFFRVGAEKRPSCALRSSIFAGLGRKQRRRTQAEPGALGGARGRRDELFWRETAAGPPRQRHGASSSPNGLGSRGESMPRLPPVSLAIDSSRAAHHGTARRRLPSLARVHTGAARLYSRWPALACAHTSPAPRRRPAPPSSYLCRAPPPSPSLYLSTSPEPVAMAERYPGDEAAANGFGRRSLHE